MLMQLQEFPWLAAMAAAIYLILKKKKVNEITENVIKAIVGWYLVLVGAELSLQALKPMDDLLNQLWGIHGGILNTEIFGSWLLRECGNSGFAAFLLAFFINVLIAKKMKKGYLFLTGHHLFFLGMMTVSLFYHEINIPFIMAAAMGGIITGIFAYTSVRVSAVSMKKINPASTACLANSAAGAALLGNGVGWLFRKSGRNDRYDKAGKSTGHITSMGVLTTFVVYIFLMLAGDKFGATSFMECIVLSLLYGASLTIITQGIRMLLSIFIQMFWEIGQKFLPELIVGLDATAIVSYSPRAWQTGFLTSAVTGILTSLILLICKAPFVPLPGLTSLYFAGGVAGVFGNAEGGKRGAAAAGAVMGIVSMLLMCLFISLGGGIGLYGSSLGETEYGILGIALSLVLRLFRR